MQPVSPVSNAPHGLKEVVFAKDQPEYRTLPALIDPDGGNYKVVTRWKLSWAERFKVLLTGSIWHSCLTFRLQLQPVMLHASDPYGDS